MILSTHGRFYEDLESYRALFFGGAKGTGKTLASVVIGEYYWRKGYKFFSNFRCDMNSDLTPDLLENGLRDSVIVYDEAGNRGLDSRDWSSQYSKQLLHVMDYARKLNLIFLFPSATEVDKRARQMACGRNKVGERLIKSLGLNSMFWHWFVDPMQDTRYTMWLLTPYAYYDLYSTKYIPTSWDDARMAIMNDFLAKYAFDAKAAQDAKQKMLDMLRQGETIPALRMQQQGAPGLPLAGIGAPAAENRKPHKLGVVDILKNVLKRIK
jgi:hypothetical protein